MSVHNYPLLTFNSASLSVDLDEDSRALEFLNMFGTENRKWGSSLFRITSFFQTVDGYSSQNVNSSSEISDHGKNYVTNHFVNQMVRFIIVNIVIKESGVGAGTTCGKSLKKFGVQLSNILLNFLLFLNFVGAFCLLVNLDWAR